MNIFKNKEFEKHYIGGNIIPLVVSVNVEDAIEHSETLPIFNNEIQYISKICVIRLHDKNHPVNITFKIDKEHEDPYKFLMKISEAFKDLAKFYKSKI